MGRAFIGSLGAKIAPPPADAVRMPAAAAAALPAKAFTKRTIVRDQDGLSACTGYAFAAAASILSGGFFLASALALYFYFRAESGFTPQQDSGAFMDPAARVMSRDGVGSEAWHPSGNPTADKTRLAVRPSTEYRAQALDHRTTVAYRALSISQVKTALALGLPVVVAFAVPASFGEVGETGVWIDRGGADVGGHAVCIVGYDDARQAVLVLNSWGSEWGTNHPDEPATKQGYFWVPYSAFPGARFYDGIVFGALDLEAAA